MEIKNTTVLITGASQGIGKAVAKKLAADECHLILVNRKKDVELQNELKAAGAKSVQIIELDLSVRADLEKFAQTHGNLKVDILFNNAGVLTGGLFEKQNLQEIYNLIQINIATLMHMTHLFFPGMIQRKSGKVINHASVSALMHFPSATTYSASKAAVHAFTECLRQELQGTGVTTLNLITPGIKTRMFDQIDEKYSQHFKIPTISMPAAKYAEIIRDAILNDVDVLNPSGLTGIGLKIAKYVPQLFEFEIRRRFKR
jgi:short-subunit dehydrogenase